MLADAGARRCCSPRTRSAGLLPAAGGGRGARLDARVGGAGRPPRRRRPAAPIRPSLAYVIYTSGSTGRPKGAMNPTAAIVNRLLWMQRGYAPRRPPTGCSRRRPSSFDVSVWELFWPLADGARLVMARPGGHQDAGVPGARRSRAQGDHDAALRRPRCCRSSWPSRGSTRAASLRRVIASGEALPRRPGERCLDRLPGAALLQPLRPHRGGGRRHLLALRAGGRPRRRADRPADRQHPHLRARPRRRAGAGRRAPASCYIGGVRLARGYLGRRS